MPLVVDGKVIVGGSGGELGVRGYVVAYDANTGKELWRTFTIPGPGEPGHETWSGDDWKSGGAPCLDDGQLVGGTNDRMFRAFHAKTGELLWEQKTSSGIMGMPIAYEVDGTQYIAVQSGWGVDAQRIQDALATQNNVGVENNVPQGGVVWVAVKK